MKVLATNRELNFKYEVLETYTCGIELKGTEVKSVRQAKVNLKDGFALIEKGEVWLKNVYIAHYEQGNRNNVDEMRNRKLLMHKEEISRLLGKVTQGGFTLVPYKMGFEHGYVKVELALCKGKKLYDKRESIKERDAKLKMAQAMKNNI
ncbi:MAG: SsrA-binding protein SmpB [Clostridia bacterium]|nr:SsrA-binding protein SmpB [Clostridia bacterium]MBR6640608.1 SsrA-binding protein SmpB [Clostridia bacterium]